LFHILIRSHSWHLCHERHRQPWIKLSSATTDKFFAPGKSLIILRSFWIQSVNFAQLNSWSQFQHHRSRNNRTSDKFCAVIFLAFSIVPIKAVIKPSFGFR
jgi:hypothetical protein